MSSPPAYPSLLLRLRTRQLALLSHLNAERHLGRAAAAMHISQPAATKLLQQVEDTLGVPLFERHTRGMTPTPYGEILIRYARRMLNDFGFVQEELVALRAGLSGVLRVGSVPGAVPELLAPMLSAYKQQHPRVSASVTVDTSNVLIRQLARGDVDLVLGREIEGHGEGDYVSVPLLEETLAVVARAQHPLAARTSISLAELVEVPWILQPPGSPQRVRFDMSWQESGIDTRLNITESASTLVTTAMLEVSDMVAIMPGSLAQHYGRLGLLCVLPVELYARLPPIYLITRDDDALSPAAARFVAQLRRYADGEAV
ncbi:LysR family transcriptional regulator [Bordetella sp. 15P40C-2]|uniref:LysR family transcriptional regulator n=1 Tax=Bordetella sp. 15P40C-2 TaxID=2572246 RepID=UPI0019206FEF|nr:LysR family transcriptional regulator [Bordetella sp. 15P40C-2]